MQGMQGSCRLLALLLAASGALRATCCVLQGQDSGHCVPTAQAAALLPFCAPYVSLYPSACLPNEYPNFPNHTALRKDAWVQAQVQEVIARRLDIEKTNGDGFKLCAWACAGVAARMLLAHSLPSPHLPQHHLTPPPPPPCSALRGHCGLADGALFQKHAVPGGLQELLLLPELPALR